MKILKAPRPGKIMNRQVNRQMMESGKARPEAGHCVRGKTDMICPMNGVLCKEDRELLTAGPHRFPENDEARKDWAPNEKH